jgi:hypothetical protein
MRRRSSHRSLVGYLQRRRIRFSNQDVELQRATYPGLGSLAVYIDMPGLVAVSKSSFSVKSII